MGSGDDTVKRMFTGIGGGQIDITPWKNNL